MSKLKETIKKFNKDAIIISDGYNVNIILKKGHKYRVLSLENPKLNVNFNVEKTSIKIEYSDCTYTLSQELDIEEIEFPFEMSKFIEVNTLKQVL